MRSARGARVGGPAGSRPPQLTIENAGVAWREAGRKLGLEGPGILAGLRLDGFIGPFEVRVAQDGHETRIVVQDGRPLASSKVRWRTAAVQRDTTGVATGDRSFDARVEVHADPLVVAAFFSAAKRRSILRAARGGGSFEDGILTLQLPEPLASASAVVSAVRAAVAVARGMAAPHEIQACLVANALRDPVPAVRLACLDRLGESYPSTASRAFRAALRDPDAAVRLRAATALPEEGRAVLRALAKDRRVEDAIQAQAIALVRPAPRELARILDAAVEHGRGGAALQAIAALGDGGGRGAVAALSPLVGSADRLISVAAIRALGATGQAGAERALVGALHSQAGEVRTAAAEALGALAAVTAVAPLRAAIAAHPRDLAMKRGARLAIEAIQMRAAGAGRGQLSIASAAPAGGLSLAASEAGRLSLEGPRKVRHGRSPQRGRRNP